MSKDKYDSEKLKKAGSRMSECLLQDAYNPKKAIEYARDVLDAYGVPELEEALKIRSTQIGVACLEHDLVHSLVCGRCHQQLKEDLRVCVEALEDINAVSRKYKSSSLQGSVEFDMAQISNEVQQALQRINKEDKG